MCGMLDQLPRLLVLVAAEDLGHALLGHDRAHLERGDRLVDEGTIVDNPPWGATNAVR